MTCRNHLACVLLVLLSAIAVSICATAQDDPFGGSSPAGTSGVLGVPTHEPDTPPERVGGHADEGGQIAFKTQTTLVQVPVIVTDASGAHIHQLTEADFKIMEDGKPQRIASLEEIVSSKQTTPAATKSGATFSNMPQDPGQARAITVIVLDEVNTPFLSQSYARAQLIKYLANHLDSSQPIGLMAIDAKGVTVLSGINSDPAALIAVLNKASGKVSEMEHFSEDAQAVASAGEMPSALGGVGLHESPEAAVRAFIFRQDAVQATYTQARAIAATLRGFLSIAWSLSGYPGRKSLIWVTGGFPFYLDSYTSVPGDPTLRALYERSVKAINDAQISIYPVDARGLLSDPAYAGNNTGSLLGADAPDLLNQSTINSLKTFAKMTGGVAYYNTNDLVGAFNRAAQDSSSYYLLSYYLDRRNTRPGWRQLKVSVTRKDAQVRARAGYLVTNTVVNPELTHQADVDFALSSPFESTGVRITEQWLGVTPNGGKKTIRFALNVPAEDLIDEADKNRFDVQIVTEVSSKGVPAGATEQTLKGLATPETLLKLKTDGVLYRNSLDLAPGNYQVKFVVRNNLSGKIGSVLVPLAVK